MTAQGETGHRGRKQARARRLERWQKKVAISGTPHSPEDLAIDPLERAEEHERGRMTREMPIYLGLAAIVNIAFVLAVGAVGSLLGSGEAPTEDNSITVEIIEEPPPTAIEIPAAEIPVPEPEPEPVPEPEPEPVPEPKPVQPIAREPEPEPEPEPPARRIVGVNLESTVEGGTGPSFAVGNTQDGSTEKVATDPRQLSTKGAARPRAAVASPNKAATFIPGTKAKLIKPKRKTRVVPTYPPRLEAQGIEANVMVKVDIDPTGKVTKVTIIKAAADDEFNKAAQAAAWKEQFEPARKDGKAIAFTLSYSYRFRRNQ